MLIGNEASNYLISSATDKGVQVKLVTNEDLVHLMRSLGLSEADLYRDRRRQGVLFGGSGGLRSTVDLNDYLSVCPLSIRRMVHDLKSKHEQTKINAGSMHLTCHYRRIKVGGLNNRDRGGHTYISTGVVLTKEDEAELEALDFKRMTRPSSDRKYEHIWWELGWATSHIAENSLSAFSYFFDRIDSVLGKAVECYQKCGHFYDSSLRRNHHEKVLGESPLGGD